MCVELGPLDDQLGVLGLLAQKGFADVGEEQTLVEVLVVGPDKEAQQVSLLFLVQAQVVGDALQVVGVDVALGAKVQKSEQVAQVKVHFQCKLALILFQINIQFMHTLLALAKQLIHVRPPRMFDYGLGVHLGFIGREQRVLNGRRGRHLMHSGDSQCRSD